ncbi:hypothetical protein FACS189476_12570 [Spirochaetia bacterium]|nr:hypothetical protein FACS189476_12570 [Spirochaetia bacterium]
MKFPVYGEPQTTQPKNSTGNEMRLYSELEVDTLIEDLTGAAEEAIEKAAAEAAKAAALASLDAQAKAWAEAQHWQGEYTETKRRGVKNAVITGVICFFPALLSGLGELYFCKGEDDAG